MSQTSDNNKRIAKNTLLLYFRMLFLMAVSLYTSRIILSALGVEDFGIYNVVGGVVAMFTVLSGSLSSAISRFITYELGTGNRAKLNAIFSTAVVIQGILALVIGVLAEIGGVWFLNNKLNIPIDRMGAAYWVLQCSILTFIINLISVPYNASIIAHERMKAFAYVSILEVVLKLVIVFALYLTLFDKLIVYSVLLVMVAIVIRLIYGFYCKRSFEECSFRFVFNRKLLKEIGNYAGWNFIGSSSAVLRDQGGNIIINLFFGPSVNAARGIASQVNSAVQGFVSNFMTALNPQITKSYAAGNREYTMTLVCQGGRLSYYMLLLLSLPLLASTHYVLVLWLNVVPEHTVLFVQLVLVFSLSEVISNPLITVQHATGKIRDYQLVVGGLQMLNLPISYILLRIGLFPEVVIVVAIVISQCCLAARLFMLKKMIGLSVRNYLRKVYVNILLVTLVSTILPLHVAYYLKESFTNFIIISLLSVVCTGCSIYFVGCNQTERSLVIRAMYNIKNKFIKR